VTDDLVKRLRALAEEEFEMLNNIHEPLQEAASRIEQLEAEIERLEKELDFYLPSP
jgi:archaellum component FlaC